MPKDHHKPRTERVSLIIWLTCRDVFCEGDCDAGVMDLAKLLGWEEELNQLIEAGPPSEANL